MLDLLHQLAVPNALARRKALLTHLKSMPLEVVKVPLAINGYAPYNIRVPLHQHTPHFLIGAHYDAVPHSPGANDNAAALVILLEILHAHCRQPFLPPIEFVFFDLEEAGMQGSLAYTQHHDLSRIYAMINLDLCGVGDHVLIAEGSRYPNQALTQAIDVVVAENDRVQRIPDLPQSDDYYFEGMRVPTASICCVPEEDVATFHTLARALRGETVIQSFPTVLETMHNRSRDTVDVVELDALRHTYNVVTTLLKQLSRDVT